MAADKDDLIQSLCSLVNNHPEAAAKLLPYIAIYGKTLKPVGSNQNGTPREIDFT